MARYYYNMSYDEKSDEFFAYVDNGETKSQIMFQIDSTDEICDHIRSGKMSHIDDVAGLTKFLYQQNILKHDDLIVLNEELLY